MLQRLRLHLPRRIAVCLGLRGRDEGFGGARKGGHLERAAVRDGCKHKEPEIEADGINIVGRGHQWTL